MTSEKEIISETIEINIEKENDSIENIIETNNSNDEDILDSDTSIKNIEEKNILKFDLESSNSRQMFHFSGDGSLDINIFDACAITNQIISTSGTSGSKQGNFKINYNSAGSLYPNGVSNLENATLFSSSSLGNYNSSVVSNNTLVGTNASELKCYTFGSGNVESSLSTLKTNAEKASGYNLTGACASFNVPTGPIIYYFGSLYTRTPSTTAYSSRGIVVPKTGSLKFASVNWARDDSPDPNLPIVLPIPNPPNNGPKIGIKINNNDNLYLFNFDNMLTYAGGNESSDLNVPLVKGDVILISYSSNFSTSGANALSLHVNLFIETNY